MTVTSNGVTDFPVLYNKDSKGKIRTWKMQVMGNQYRTLAGLENGKETESGWSTAEPKNVGRANSTTGEQQAVIEVNALYTKKRDRKYYDSRFDAEQSQDGGHKFFAPMLAEKYESWDKLRGRTPLIYSQPKLDGIRAVMTKDDAMSRSGKPFETARFIIEELEAAKIWEGNPGLMLDGELYNHDHKDNFNKIQKIVTKGRDGKPLTPELQELLYDSLQYHIYDVPSVPGPFGKRIAWAMEHLKPLESVLPIRVVPTALVGSEEELDQAYGQWLELGYEGQIIRLDTDYENRRTYSLLKRKQFLEEEFPLVRVEEGDGNWKGLAKRVVIRLKDGRECEAGLRGNKAFTKELLENKPWPKECTIRFQNYTPDGMLRIGVATKFYQNGRDA